MGVGTDDNAKVFAIVLISGGLFLEPAPCGPFLGSFLQSPWYPKKGKPDLRRLCQHQGAKDRKHCVSRTRSLIRCFDGGGVGITSLGCRRVRKCLAYCIVKVLRDAMLMSLVLAS